MPRKMSATVIKFNKDSYSSNYPGSTSEQAEAQKKRPSPPAGPLKLAYLAPTTPR